MGQLRLGRMDGQIPRVTAPAGLHRIAWLIQSNCEIDGHRTAARKHPSPTTARRTAPATMQKTRSRDTESLATNWRGRSSICGRFLEPHNLAYERATIRMARRAKFPIYIPWLLRDSDGERFRNLYRPPGWGYDPPEV